MGLVDIERIRVSAERDAYGVLEREEHRSRGQFTPQDGTAKRRAVMANALLLTETMAPDVYDAAHAAMAALGVGDRIELFQSSGHGVDTARLVLFGQPIGIEFIGGYLDCLDRGGLLAVLGHEIGHCLAHSGHPVFAWARPACGGRNSPAKRAYAMAVEFTADRFGLLACRDLDAVLRLEMQGAVRGSPKSIRFDTGAYLTQCRAVAEEMIATGGIATGNPHPEHYVRGYAEWLFAETDLYKELTGLGPGSRSIDQVNAIVHKLVGFPRRPGAPASGVSMAKPPPRAGPAQGMDATHAVVGERNDEDAAKGSTPHESLEGLAADILTDGARRKLGAARDAIASLAGAAATTVGRAMSAAGEQPAEPKKVDPSAEGDRSPSLARRFEEFARRAKDK